MQTIANKKQIRMYNTLRALQDLPKVTVIKENDLNTLWIWHEQEFVPGFEFHWCTQKEQYRVYIWVASRETQKQRAGYCICTIGSILGLTGFIALYSFLHKHRANNKIEAYQA